MTFIINKSISWANFNKIAAVLFSVVFCIQASQAADGGLNPSVNSLNNTTPKRVLFVGNSYFYYNDSLHNHVNRLLASIDEQAHEDIAYKSATIGGASLDQHPIDTLLLPGQMGIDEKFDLVILQGGSSEPLSSRRRKEFLEAAAGLQAKISASGAETALYMTHAYSSDHRRYDPDMTRDIESLYLEAGNQIGALVIPVGLAFEEAYRRSPDMALHKTFDGSHPDILGTYLAACVLVASVYELSPVGASYDYFGEVNKADALFLQTVAQDTVTRFYDR